MIKNLHFKEQRSGWGHSACPKCGTNNNNSLVYMVYEDMQEEEHIETHYPACSECGFEGGFFELERKTCFECEHMGNNCPGCSTASYETGNPEFWQPKEAAK